MRSRARRSDGDFRREGMFLDTAHPTQNHQAIDERPRERPEHELRDVVAHEVVEQARAEVLRCHGQRDDDDREGDADDGRVVTNFVNQALRGDPLKGEKEFTALYHQGAAGSMYLSDIAGAAILAAVFDKRTTLGMVRLKTRAVVPQLVELLQEVAVAANEAKYVREVLQRALDAIKEQGGEILYGGGRIDRRSGTSRRNTRRSVPRRAARSAASSSSPLSASDLAMLRFLSDAFLSTVAWCSPACSRAGGVPGRGAPRAGRVRRVLPAPQPIATTAPGASRASGRSTTTPAW